MRTYKLVVLGSGGVGKSALTIQFVQNVFVTNYDPTIEDCYQKTMKDFILEIYDTAGIDQFAVSKDELIRTGDGFALVYSITSRTTCNDLEDMREQIIRIKNSSNVPMILVGNKCDLEDERKVMTSYGSRLAQIYKCKFYETSAKDRTNVENMFYELSQLIIDKEKAEQEQEYLKKKSFYQSHSSLFKKKKKHCHFL